MKFKIATLAAYLLLWPASSRATELCLIIRTALPGGISLYYDGKCTDGKTFKSDSVSAYNPFFQETRMKTVLSELLSMKASEGYQVLKELSVKTQHSLLPSQQMIVIARGMDSRTQICTTHNSEFGSCTDNVSSLPFSHDFIKSKTVDADSVLKANGFKRAGDTNFGVFGLTFFER